MDNLNISNVLVNAVEYLEEFRNHIFVIKLGGEVMLDDKVLGGIARDAYKKKHF